MNIMNSTIVVRDMRIYAYHGALEHERRVGAEYLVSLEAVVDVAHAMHNDQLADTLNYALLFQWVKEEMAQPSNLLEHVAYRIAKRVEEGTSLVKTLKVTIQKTHPPISGFDADGVLFVATFTFDR